MARRKPPVDKDEHVCEGMLPDTKCVDGELVGPDGEVVSQCPCYHHAGVETAEIPEAEPTAPIVSEVTEVPNEYLDYEGESLDAE